MLDVVFVFDDLITATLANHMLGKFTHQHIKRTKDQIVDDRAYALFEPAMSRVFKAAGFFDRHNNMSGFATAFFTKPHGLFVRHGILC